MKLQGLMFALLGFSLALVPFLLVIFLFLPFGLRIYTLSTVTRDRTKASGISKGVGSTTHPKNQKEEPW
jgi:hypothetical protein